MNTFLGIGTYTGERFTDNGLRFMEMQLPKVGNSGGDVPIMVVPNRAAGESFDVFQPGGATADQRSYVPQSPVLQDVCRTKPAVYFGK